MAATRLEVPLIVDAAATGQWVDWPGGEGRFDVAGGVSGATITLQVKGADGSTAHAVSSETTLTAAGTAGFKLEGGCSIRAHVAGGTPSGLFVSAYRNA